MVARYNTPLKRFRILGAECGAEGEGRTNVSTGSMALSLVPRRQGRGPRRSPWHGCVAFAGLVFTSTWSLPACTGLEVIETVVDRDGDVLVVEDILEGFGRVPVSVAFSPTSSHMFIGFKAGEVRIYPEGGDTTVAAVYDSCVDMEDTVSFSLAVLCCAAVLCSQRSSCCRERTQCLVGSNGSLEYGRLISRDNFLAGVYDTYT